MKETMAELDAQLRAYGLDPEELDRKMLERLEAEALKYESRGEIPPPQFREMLRQFREHR